MLPNALTVAAKRQKPEREGGRRVLRCRLKRKPRALPHGRASAARGAPLVDKLYDADGDGAEQEDVYKPFLAQHEFTHEPRGEERRSEQTDVQVKPNPFA